MEQWGTVSAKDLEIFHKTDSVDDAYTYLTGKLVNHIGAWADIPRRRILGEIVAVTEEVNFPPMTSTSEDAWTDH
jgi:hypothetical protein